MKLSQQQVEQFRRDGVIELGRVLTEDELVQARRRFEKLFNELLGTTDRGLRNLFADESKPEQQYKTPVRHYQMVNLWQKDEFYKGLLYKPEFLDKVESVIGPDIALLHDQVFYKPAGDGARSGWHQDNSYWNYTPPDLVSIWVPLDDVDLGNGALHFIPGSHLEPSPPMNCYKLPSGVDANELIIDEKRLRPIILKAGHALMHHCMTIHGAYANESNRERRALAIHYIGGRARDAKGGFPRGAGNPVLRGNPAPESAFASAEAVTA